MSTQGNNLTAIANAIRAKDGTSAPIVANDFAARIAAIPTGQQLPTLTNPGTASDLVAGKQLINGSGDIVTGTIQENPTGNFVLSNGSVFFSTAGDGSQMISISAPIPHDLVGRQGKSGIVSSSATNFGNATAADVVAGKTFTSEAGVKVTGTGQFLKFGLYQFTGYGSANTGIPSYPSNNYPYAIFIAMNNAIPYTNNTVFQMSVVNQAGCISGANFVRYNEVYYGAYTSDKISLVLDHDAMQLLIYPPKPSSSEFITFENGKPYSIYYFYT